AELRDVRELARELSIERHQEVRPHLVAELVVRRRKEVGATAGCRFRLELVEDLIERDLEDRDLRTRVRGADLVDELVESRLLRAARPVRVPERDVPGDGAGGCAAARAWVVC